MPARSQRPSRQSLARGPLANFSESGAWADVRAGWHPLHGSFRDLGYSIEWHDFTAERDLDWSRSFHPNGVEICLNLDGHAAVEAAERTLELAPLTAGFYLQREPRLAGRRAGGQAHRFVTVELSFAFLSQHLAPGERGLNARLAEIHKPRAAPQVSEPFRMTTEHQQLVGSLRRPPVFAGAQRLWYQAKALEIAAAFFYLPAAEEELFCQRQQRQNRERAQKVIAILRQDLAESLSLEEIGRRVGCSHFHLSRLFSQETGKSIFQCLRELRMERAAELLREGRLNVTQVALEVGYSSPGHFSTAFHAAFGCCPGLYPMETTSQRLAKP